MRLRGTFGKKRLSCYIHKRVGASVIAPEASNGSVRSGAKCGNLPHEGRYFSVHGAWLYGVVWKGGAREPMKQSKMDSSADISKEARLRLMQRRALALLLCMVGLYLACHLCANRWLWLLWPKAFAEAAIVGGLADWFAVVALFRHPFGIPIPHTAILPRRKRYIAETVATFVVENFLCREVLQCHLGKVNFVDFATGWLRREASFLARNLAALLPQLLDLVDQRTLAAVIHGQIVRQASKLPLAQFTGKLLGILTSGGRHEVLLDEGLRLAGQLLAEHRDSIEEAIRKEVPLPDYLLLPGVFSLEQIKKSVAAWVAQKLVDRVHQLLKEAASSREHPVRQRFTQRVERLVEELQFSPEYATKGEELKGELLASPLVFEYVESASLELVAYFKSLLQDGGTRGADALERAAKALCGAVEADVELGLRLNDWLRGAVGVWVDTHRPQLEGVIRETIEGWDAAQLSRKLEVEVGADLQFVRMNGTLIGGSVGLILHLCSKLLG